MTTVIVLLLLVTIGLVAGVGYTLYREILTLRVARVAEPPPPAPQLAIGAGTIRELQTQLESQHQTELERLRADARATIGELHTEVAGLHTEVATLHRAIQSLSSQSSSLSDELAARPPVALPEVISVTRTTPPSGAVSELYAQLARLEVAFLTLANPVLLPGEPFTNADELPAETLRWESWKEIGDQAFGFAELYAAKRVLLDAGPRAAAGHFITAVRELLTTRIYPALATASRFDRGERADKIKVAVSEMAQAIEHVRDALEIAHDGAPRQLEG